MKSKSDVNDYLNLDLNVLYKNVLRANNNAISAKKKYNNISFNSYLNALKAVQRSVDLLFDKTDVCIDKLDNNMSLKSVTRVLKGKDGRFRNSVLAKRVDYSGRSVIAPGPDLRLNECFIPREMIYILFESFLLAKMISDYDMFSF